MFGFGAKCGHCNQSGTQLIEIEPTGAAYKQVAVSCSHCSAVLGITDYYDSGTLLKKLETKVNGLQQQLQQVQHSLQTIEYALRR